MRRTHGLPVIDQQPTAFLPPWQTQPLQQQQTAPPEPVAAPASQVVVIPAPPAAAPPADLLKDPAVIAAIEAARQQEKDKLYGTIEELKGTTAQNTELLATFQADREAAAEAQRVAEEAAAAALEAKRMSELSLAERLEEVQRGFTTQLGELQSSLTQRDALLAKEREYAGLVQYRADALGSEVGQQILPELRDLVTGGTAAEIDASLSTMAERSAAILGQVAQAQQQGRSAMRGVGVTAPPVGPSDTNSGNQTYTAEDLAAMDMSTYASLRGRLLGGAAQPQRGQGMFG